MDGWIEKLFALLILALGGLATLVGVIRKGDNAKHEGFAAAIDKLRTDHNNLALDCVGKNTLTEAKEEWKKQVELMRGENRLLFLRLEEKIDLKDERDSTTRGAIYEKVQAIAIQVATIAAQDRRVRHGDEA